jgi:SAM-dependent methyltransferase
MTYQTFPGKRGGSASLDKLMALRFPPFAGKRFLDVGCNAGFFCGYALFDGANRVVGIDRSKASLDLAKQKFPAVEFHNQSWDTLPEGPYDVILLASALHYAEDQEALIHRLMSRLAEDGTLVLELGVVDSQNDEWVLVKRSIDDSIDERPFPTWGKISTILEKYRWERIGCSVPQAGDETPRYVLHVHHLKPDAPRALEITASIPGSINGLLEADSSSPAHAKEKANKYYNYLVETILVNERDTIRVKKIRNKNEILPYIFEWYLDNPRNSQPITDDQQLNIAGWVLPSQNAMGKIVCFIEGKYGKCCYELNILRPDVIAAIIKDNKVQCNISEKCGFNFKIPLNEIYSGINFGFIVGDRDLCVAKIEISSVEQRKTKRNNSLFGNTYKLFKKILR